jgi:hypothetical protein
VFAAQEIKPQARTLAEDRGIRSGVVVDYDALRGIDDSDGRLFEVAVASKIACVTHFRKFLTRNFKVRLSAVNSQPYVRTIDVPRR